MRESADAARGAPLPRVRSQHATSCSRTLRPADDRPDPEAKALARGMRAPSVVEQSHLPSGCILHTHGHCAMERRRQGGAGISQWRRMVRSRLQLSHQLYACMFNERHGIGK